MRCMPVQFSPVFTVIVQICEQCVASVNGRGRGGLEENSEAGEKCAGEKYAGEKCAGEMVVCSKLMTVVKFATDFLPLNGANEPRPYTKEKNK